MTSSAATRATLIAARLREHRRCSGLSQQEAAARVGVTQGTWSRWESGKHAPKAEHLGPLSELLACPVVELLGD